MSRSGAPGRVITKTYGRGSLLGFLGPLYAYVMAAAGMHGWEDSARRAMEADAAEMSRRGYRVVSADEFRLPVLGIAWFRVAYAPPDTPAAPSGEVQVDPPTDDRPTP